MTRYVLLAASVFLVALALACGGGGSKESQDAAALLKHSATVTTALKSFHFKLSHENGATPMPLNLQLVSAEGDVVTPDRLSADVRAKAASVTASVKVISVADRTWITNPFNRKWQQLPGASIRDIADPAKLVTSLLNGMSEPAYAGEEEVAGDKTYHLTAKIDAGALSAALPGEAGRIANVDLWLGTIDGLPRRARITGPLAAGEPENIVRQIDLSKFNSLVTIQPPPE